MIPSLAAVLKQRQQRGIKLLARRPQAAPLLEFYIELLDLQAELADWAAESVWPEAVRATDAEFPRIRLDRMPVDVLLPRFEAFVPAAAERGTELLREIAGKLAGAGAAEEALGGYLARKPLEDLGKRLDCDPLQVAFFPRAFVAPLAESLVVGLEPPPESWEESFCPACGGAPQLAVLVDERLIKSRRLLECGLCATRWPFRRSLCPHCGEQSAEKLQIHAVEDSPHVRLDTCGTCQSYLKSIDLRRDGLAVPVVDELGTVELDLWADEQGFWKITPNLMGI